MNRYINYGPKDFALDRFFQRWVTNPDQETDQYWAAFLREFPHKRDDIEKATKMVQLAGFSADREANAYFLEVWSKLDTNAKKSVRTTRQAVVTYASFAAAFIGLMTLVIYFLGTGNDFSEYKTAYGQTRKLELADGSTVTLNANSVVRVASDFADATDRKVYLEGEAFFEVVKTENKTFTVETSREVSVRVLGTRFNVNTRHENVSVYLQSGKVSLSSPSNSIILNPGQSARFNKTSKQVYLADEPAAVQQDRIAWRDGMYIMNDKRVSEIISDLQDNYGLDVIVNVAEIAERRVTAKIPAGDIDLLLEVLAETLEVKIERSKNKVIVSAK